MFKKTLHVVMVCFLVAMFAGLAVAQDNVTISGTINDANQLVSEDGEIYDIADTEQGASLAENIGKKVTVTGAVQEADGAKTVVVEAFELIAE